MIEEIRSQIEPFAEGNHFDISLTSDLTYGDFTSNIALVLASKHKENPRSTAESIVRMLEQKGGIPHIQRIEVAGPGFINFFLDSTALFDCVKKAYENPKKYASTTVFTGKEVLIEYTQPNPLKVFHIGHLMSNAIGESLARLYEVGGATVRRLNYQGDVGLHIGKALWGMKHIKTEMPHDSVPLSQRTAWLGRAYVEGARAFEEDETAKEEIYALSKAVYEQDLSILDLYKKGRQWSLDHFEEIYQILGTVFDRYYFESETSPIGYKAVLEHTPDVFKESDGALIYPGEDEGLHNRVFITSRGVTAYEAKDLGLCILKHTEYPHADISIVVTAEEQKEYMRVIKASINKIIPSFAHKFIHITHGMMQLSEGKMSSRKGNVISGESLLFDAIQTVQGVMKERGYSGKEKEEIAQSVAVAAVKFPILKQALGKNISFNLETSLSLEGDTGAYIQYARVRACSVIAKSKEKIEIGAENIKTDTPGNLERILSRFPQSIERAQNEKEPHHIAVYLIQLAQAWNSYYSSHQIIGVDTTPYRLMIAHAVAGVIEEGMNILGMTVPDKM